MISNYENFFHNFASTLQCWVVELLSCYLITFFCFKITIKSLSQSVELDFKYFKKLLSASVFS